jgi:hypothetical protein
VRWSSRWFLLSLLFGVGAFALAWKTGDTSVFAAIGSVALAGGHATNVAERIKRLPDTDIPEAS